ncbi:hypothetical protein CHS0354_028621 [Potamilus streckersoni]|uniref:Uncharacterized protein n=1 Tax=Potamilus streckersoni TaxID=2493646 RepID=A0AAE0VKH5_9BIVA|nr:hypothetical protein CHS0354_028621 [Potamilus streckersoni]
MRTDIALDRERKYYTQYNSCIQTLSTSKTGQEENPTLHSRKVFISSLILLSTTTIRYAYSAARNLKPVQPPHFASAILGLQQECVRWCQMIPNFLLGLFYRTERSLSQREGRSLNFMSLEYLSNEQFSSFLEGYRDRGGVCGFDIFDYSALPTADMAASHLQNILPTMVQPLHPQMIGSRLGNS